jgi:hypothetical protein
VVQTGRRNVELISGGAKFWSQEEFDIDIIGVLYMGEE